MSTNEMPPVGAGGGCGTERDGQSARSYHITPGGARQGPAHGVVRGDTWTKRVRASVHQLHRPPSWAVDVGDLDAAEACGAVFLELREQERGVTYRCSLATLRRKGFAVNRACGQQWALALGHWSTGGGDLPQAEPTGARQLGLFGGRL